MNKKIYEGRKSKRLVSKKGKPFWYNINKYIKTLEKELDPIEFRTRRSLLKDEIEDRKRKGKELTIDGFRGTLEKNNIRRMLRNMGYTAEEFAEEYDVPVEDILNESNWDGDTFTSGDYTYEYRFGYNGNNLVRIKEK